jgi:hypothetical protein
MLGTSHARLDVVATSREARCVLGRRGDRTTPPDELNWRGELMTLQARLAALGLARGATDFFCGYTIRLSRFEELARKNRRLYQRLRVPAVVVAPIVPALIAANLGETGRWIATALGVFVAAAAAAEELLGPGRQHRHFRGVAEQLKREGWSYLGLSGDYRGFDSHAAAFDKFSYTVDKMLASETQKYTTGVIVPPQAPPPREPPAARESG